MSAKLTGRSFLTALKRRLSSQAQAVRHESIESTGLQVSKLPTGVTVASLDSGGPVARVALVVNAGPRFERHDQLGLTHCLRVAADQCTNHYTSFEVARRTLQMGAQINCTTTRENIIYSLNCVKDSLDEGLNILVNMATQQSFKPWEIQDIQGRMALDGALIHQQPQARLVEILHKLAYRDSLGRSLYAPEFNVGKFDCEMLMEYVNTNYTANRMALIGVGVGHKRMVKCSKALPNNSGTTSATQTTYYGGESHIEAGGDLAYAALVTEGASIGSKDVVALSLLQQIMGCCPNVKWSSGMSRLSQAASKASDQPHAVSCINLNYSDSGLFGFYAVAEAEEMSKVLKSLVGQFAAVTKSGVTDQEVQKAKTGLKAALTMQAESSSAYLEDVSQQLMAQGSVQHMQDLARTIDSVSTQDVHNVAKRVINGKASMVAIGNLGNTPHLDDLM